MCSKQNNPLKCCVVVVHKKMSDLVKVWTWSTMMSDNMLLLRKITSAFRQIGDFMHTLSQAFQLSIIV